MEYDSSELTAEAAYKLLIGCVVPRPIAWISTLSAKGLANLAPFSAFTFVSSKPPMIAVSIGQRISGLKDTVKNIMRDKEFVVNIADFDLIEAVGRSFIDLDNGIFYRLAQGKQATKKRQRPVPIPTRLLAHLRRWRAKSIAQEYFVEWNGKPVKSVKTAFRSAVTLAGLPGKIIPHTLRHTAATTIENIGGGRSRDRTRLHCQIPC